MLRWNKLDRPLILASQSPRRKQIMTHMGLAFTVELPSVENENRYIDENNIEESIQRLASAKARSVADARPQSLVLGADTIVVIRNRVIGKPRDRRDAKQMLLRLSGTMHTVYTGVALVCADRNFTTTATARSEVFFRAVEEWEIDDYLAGDEYADKAGAYAIQGRAMTFVDKINGCFYNVMGLPVYETISSCSAYLAFLKGQH